MSTFDAAVRRFLGAHPDGTVVALGEGLETQFWRLDNGRVRCLTVDLPATLDLRGRVLPDGARLSRHAGSALDPGWLERLEPSAPVLITAQGLLPYFRREEVHGLIAMLAERLPGRSLVFDAVPVKMLELVEKAPAARQRDQALELWSWFFSSSERAAIAGIRGVARVGDLAPPFAPGVVPLILQAVRRLPRGVRYALPVFPVVEVTFR